MLVNNNLVLILYHYGYWVPSKLGVVFSSTWCVRLVKRHTHKI